MFAKSAISLAVLVGVISASSSTQGMNSSESDEWDQFFANTDEAKALAVNEGDLEFLSSPPAKPPHLLQNRFEITRESMNNGWVKLLQCHENLDAVSQAQILYHARRTRNLEVLSSHHVGRAWVEDNSVQMENIGRKATICVGADVKALYSNFNGSYSMRNGPFHRRFLDGYYPMQVTMDITMPKDLLSFEDIMPQAQDGFRVTYNRGKMTVDALFVGELSIEVYFQELQNPKLQRRIN